MSSSGNGLMGSGDGGSRFRADWPDLDKENWEWMQRNNINPKTGKIIPPRSLEADGEGSGSGMDSKRTDEKAAAAIPAVALVKGESSWLGRNKVLVITFVVVFYAAIGRIFFSSPE